ncbi:MAG TPA: hypothetical protein VNO70_22985 [Blastocatellia bacterium]|nr:hypothetical protein [Blastocatellia bacterium]
MKKLAVFIIIALVGLTAPEILPAQDSYVYAQKKRDRDDKKKDPPGPPVVKDKDKGPKGRDDKKPPKRDRKPPDD